MTDLNDRLLAAHARGDRAGLVTLYEEAAERAAGETETGFFLTQAYVFALETGHSRSAELRSRLVAMGRESN